MRININDNRKTSQSQTRRIYRYLSQGKSLTSLKALELFNCFRLGARIFELREKGHEIKSEIVRDERTGKRFARYSMPEVIDTNKRIEL